MRLFQKGLLVPLTILSLYVPAFSADARAKGNAVFVNGVSVLEFRASSGADPSIRAALVARSLASMQDGQPIKIKKAGKQHQLLIGDTPFMTVTPSDAKSYKVSTASLATTWATRIKQALTLPSIKLSEDAIQLPLGATKTVRIIGSKAANATVSTFGDSPVQAVRTEEGMTVKAISIGSGSIVLNADGEIFPLNVTVKPYASTFPQNTSAEVTGMPASSVIVKGAIETALKTQLQGVPMSKFTYDLPDVSQIPVGEAKSFPVKVKATAPDAYEATGTVNILVRNVPVPRRPDSELWYSNNPELIKQAGPLFSANLKQNEPARLLYHHSNAMSQAVFLRVQAINDSDVPAKVVVTPGDGSPHKNPVLVGLVAADQYFRAWTLGSGEVVTIPPRSALPISLRRMGSGETASGLCGLRLINGPESLLVRTDIWPPFPLDPKWTNAVASSTPWREVGCQPINDFDRAPNTISEHIYPNPQKVEQVRYEVGGRYGFVRIGQRPINRLDNASRLDGNFGVIYSIRADLENPTQVPAEIEVVFEASAGYSGGLFLVNGNIIRTPLLQPKGEFQLAKVKVEPGAKNAFDITTIPLSGSSYPATLTIRPIQAANLRTPVIEKK